MSFFFFFNIQVFTWNTDAWGYGTGTTSLYQSHPWVLAVLPNGEALGVLADTTRRCEVLLIFKLMSYILVFMDQLELSYLQLFNFHNEKRRNVKT